MQLEVVRNYATGLCDKRDQTQSWIVQRQACTIKSLGTETVKPESLTTTVRLGASYEQAHRHMLDCQKVEDFKDWKI